MAVRRSLKLLLTLSCLLCLFIFAISAPSAEEVPMAVAASSGGASSSTVLTGAGTQSADGDDTTEAVAEANVWAAAEETILLAEAVASAISDPSAEEAAPMAVPAAISSAVLTGAGTQYADGDDTLEAVAAAAEVGPGAEEPILVTEAVASAAEGSGVVDEGEEEDAGSTTTTYELEWPSTTTTDEVGETEDERSVQEGRSDSESGESVSDLLAVDIECSGVPDFPNVLFDEHPDKEKVYDIPAKMPEGIFSKMGFDRFVSVFGVHIVGSSGVSDETLTQAAHVFAGVVDNDEDGTLDNPDANESVRKYNTVIGYVQDPEDSDKLWKEMYVQEENEGFRAQFACNMHFFEQWASDATPEFYLAMFKRRPEECGQLDQVEFDWRLWYFPFTVTYYGYLEVLKPEILEKITTAMEHARKEQVFFGNYPDDDEMEVADFFVWSLLTYFGALECHCKSDIIETVWKVCTGAALKELDPEWYELLAGMEGIPKKLPTGKYSGSALFVAGVTEEEASTGGGGESTSSSREEGAVDAAGTSVEEAAVPSQFDTEDGGEGPARVDGPVRVVAE